MKYYIIYIYIFQIPIIYDFLNENIYEIIRFLKLLRISRIELILFKY